MAQRGRQGQEPVALLRYRTDILGTEMSKKLLLLLGLCFVEAAPLHSGPAPDFSIDRHTIDAGGSTSSGGEFSLTGTIGQFDAVPGGAQGGAFTLVGGFWGGTVEFRFSSGFEDF